MGLQVIHFSNQKWSQWFFLPEQLLRMILPFCSSLWVNDFLSAFFSPNFAAALSSARNSSLVRRVTSLASFARELTRFPKRGGASHPHGRQQGGRQVLQVRGPSAGPPLAPADVCLKLCGASRWAKMWKILEFAFGHDADDACLPSI